MAVSGHNGNNETFIGMSSSASLSFYDENTNEIKISQSNSPIDMILQRDKKALEYAYQYINATNITLSAGTFYLQNSFKIKMLNASLHIELMPLDINLSYLIVLKLD